MAANIPNWTVQPPKGLLKGDYYRIEERFPPYYTGVDGQFPADPGHLGIIEVIKNGDHLDFIELNEITAPSYYCHLYSGISKRRSSYSFWQYTKPRMQVAGVTLTMGMEYVEKQMMERQSLVGDFDMLASASGSVKKLAKIAAKLQEQLDKPSKQRIYSYSEDYGYGLTGWLKVVVEDGRIVSCRFDEIFADEPEQIVHPELKKYYRQSKYDSITYESPYPDGFNALSDLLQNHVLATQDLLDLTGLPWTRDTELRKRDVEWDHYLHLAQVIADAARKDGRLA